MAWPDDRPETYDEDKFWDDEEGAWYSVGTAIGSERLRQAGGRYRSQIVVLSNKAKLYFGGA